MNKRHRMSASYTFLLACGLQVDHCILGGGSLGRASLATTAGRHSNAMSAPGNGVANDRTKRSLAVRPISQQQQKQRKNDDHNFIDIRL